MNQAPGPSPRLGDYTLLRELGRGAMGAVYVARKDGSTRDVALKVMLQVGADDAEAAERFRREALGTARLSHPNIVGIDDYGVAGGHPFIVMKLVSGEPLAHALRRGPFPTERAAEVATALARAVAHAHQRGVLHRDLKPDNVLIEDGVPRLTDFGLAKLSGTQQERLTRTGDVVGTPAFMAPEQAMGERTVDERTDVYGLGATLYAMLTGGPPFAGSTVLAVLTQVASNAPAPPSLVAPGVDPALEAICLRCLEKDPEQRFPSAAALAEALEHYDEASAGGGLSLGVLALGVGLGLSVAVAAIAVAVTLRGPSRPADPAADAARPDPVGSQPTDAGPQLEAPQPTAPPVGWSPERRAALLDKFHKLRERTENILIGKLSEADLRSCDRRIAELPFYGFTYFLRALVLRRLGRDDEALAALERAEAAPIAFEGYFVHLFRARWLADLGRYAEVVPALQAALAAPDAELLELLYADAGLERPSAFGLGFPSADTRPEALSLLIEALGRLGRHDEAAALAPDVEALEAPDWFSYVRLAESYAALGQRRAALEATARVTNAPGGHKRTEALALRTRLHREAGELAEAETTLIEADTARQGQAGAVTHPMLYLERARTEAARGDPPLHVTITCRKSILAWGRGSFSVTLLPRPLFQRDPHDQAREQRRQQAARERLILAALQVIIDVRFRRMNWGRGQISLDLSQPLLELFKGDPTPGEALLSRVEWPPELR